MSFVVVNPGGRDPDQSFADGSAHGGHPPVNYHGYAACLGGSFLRNVDAVPSGTRLALVLLRKRNLRRVLSAIAKLQARGIRAFISFKESGAHQIADFLDSFGRSQLFCRICRMADGFIASTPQAESLYRSVGCARGMFIPTPYPIHMDEWNLGKPLAERMGIFVGTREFDVPSRNHWQAVALANQLSLELQVPAAVMNAAGRRGLMILTAIRETNPFLQIIVGPLGYRDYLRLMASHRCVVQLDSSAVPGQVAGDALLCRMPCVGGNGAVEKIAFPPLADCSPQEAASHVRRLMTSDEEWQSAVVASQAEANRRLSFAVVGEALQRLCEP